MKNALLYGVLISSLTTGMNALAGSATDTSKALAIADAGVGFELPLTTRIEALDGEPVSGLWHSTTELAIEPGEHSLTLSCYTLANGVDVLAEKQQSLIFEAGKRYVFTAQLVSSSSCEISREVQTI